MLSFRALHPTISKIKISILMQEASFNMFHIDFGENSFIKGGQL